MDYQEYLKQNKVFPNATIVDNSALSTENVPIARSPATAVSSQPVTTQKSSNISYFGGTAALPQRYAYDSATGKSYPVDAQNNPMSVSANTSTPTSSMTTALNQNVQRATTTAINNISNPQPSQQPLNPIQQWYMNTYGVDESTVRALSATPEGMNNLAQTKFSMDQSNKTAEQEKSAQAQRAAAAMAKQDAQFAMLHKKIEDQRQGSLSMSNALAYAKNPYAATGSTTGDNQMLVNQKYDSLLSEAMTQYGFAKQALEAGNSEAYAGIMAKLNNSINSASKEMQSTFNTLKSQKIQQEQFEQTRDLNLQKASQDDLMKMIETFSTSPELQRDVDSFLSSGNPTPALEPFFKRASEAGIGTNEVASILRYGTDKARYQERQLDVQQARLNSYLDRQTTNQLWLQTQKAVTDASNSLLSQGYRPGTIDYATGVALATFGSPQKLTSADVDKYTNIMSLSNRFSELKSGVESLDKGSSLFTILTSHAGQTVQSLTSDELAVVNLQLQALSGPIGKSLFSESGNLSNTDINRMLGMMPTGKVTTKTRDALYNSMVGILADRATLVLQNDALAGKPVMNYAPAVKQLVETASSNVIGGSSGQKFSFSFNGKTYTFPDQKSLEGFKKEIGIK